MTERLVEVVGDSGVARARSAARAVVQGCSDTCVHAVELVTGELTTNALLHGGGRAAVRIVGLEGGARIEVADASPQAPFVGQPSADAMTGRGLALVARLARRWGVEPAPDGKVVWAEVIDGGVPAEVRTQDELLAAWDDPVDGEATSVRVTLGEVPTALLVAAKRHVDNLVREFALAAGGDRLGTTAPVPAPLAELIDRVVHRFGEARLAIKRQATEAAGSGARHTVLELDLPLDVADAAEEYVDALDEIDDYCRANRLLTLETPPQHRVFRRWYVGEIVSQLRAAQAHRPRPPVLRFEDRLLAEVDRAEQARREADRAAHRHAVALALLQRRLLPAALPTIEGLDLGAAYAAAGEGVAVGGDFYDAFRLDDRHWVVTMGDVRGRGPEAAAVTGLVRYTLRTAVLLGRTPAQALVVLDEAMAAEGDDDERFCSAVCAVIAPGATGAELTYASAGHPPLAVVRPAAVEMLPPTGPLAGIIEGAAYDEGTTALAPGDALVLYTDGISEARHHGREFGEAGLVEALTATRGRSAQDVADELTAAAHRFSPATTDDAAVLAVIATP